MFNKVILLGNLTRDINIKFIQSGLTILNNAIATTIKFKVQDGLFKEKTLFIDVTFFGRTAKVVQKYLHKGSKVLVEGRLELDQWTDQTGQKRSKNSISVETMQMMDSKNSPTLESKHKEEKLSNGTINTTNNVFGSDENPFQDEINNNDLPFKF